MDREVVGTGFAYRRRHDFDDPEGERDLRHFVQITIASGGGSHVERA
jgi:hypothetical protein